MSANIKNAVSVDKMLNMFTRQNLELVAQAVA
jgi:MFS superfamily sulfate permease-like transporter